MIATASRRPADACANCWSAWFNARPRAALGYCWHGKVAWRVKASGEFVSSAGVTREEHLAMVEYLAELASVSPQVAPHSLHDSEAPIGWQP